MRQRAQRDARHGGALPVARRLLHFGGVWRQRQQALDGIARAVGGVGFQLFCDNVQCHDHGRFWPLPNQKRTGYGHSHQGIDVQLAVAQGNPAFAVHRKAGQRDAGGR